MVGQTLSNYQISQLLGKGGMGEVWLATDTKLDRNVAIKVLPEAMAQDKERLLRFEREAKLLASLNHTNIAQIYGFEESGDKKFLVLEFVEGETLADRLKRGPVPIEEALDIGKQVAEALEAAHQNAVIHRDLKPGNIMIREDSTVKVLDFGLARAMASDASGETEIAASPTITADFTRPGVVLGTAQYMSPEQARGRSLDKRTDIWSFGVILYECLTGERLFQGETATDSMGAIMHRDPDWSLLPSNTPPTVHLLLRRCLTKDRKRRLHDVADARVELEEAIHDPTSSSLNLAQVAVTEQDRAEPRRGSFAGSLMAFLLGSILIAAIAWSQWPAPERQSTRRFEFATDMKPRLAVISPDGSAVAYVSENDVYIRDLDTLQTRMLWDHESEPEIRSLYWSPDSRSLGVQSGSKFWRIQVDRGQPIQVAESDSAFDPSWSDEGFLILADFQSGALVAISDRGGEQRTIAEKREDEVHFHGAVALPQGKGFVVDPHPKDSKKQTLERITMDGTRHVLYRTNHAIFPHAYSRTGHLLFSQSTEPKGIWALPFSLEQLQVTGEPFLVLPGVEQVSVSDQGDLVHTHHQISGEARRLAWVDREGKVLEELGPNLFGTRELILAPDGRQVALSATGLSNEEPETRTDIWIVDLTRGSATQLAAEEGFQRPNVWTPDSMRLAYTTMAEGLDESGIYLRNADGSGQPELLRSDAIGFSPVADWSSAAFTVGDFQDGLWIVTRKLNDEDSEEVFIKSDLWVGGGLIRPGGGLIFYYTSKNFGEEQFAYLRRFPEGEGRWQVSMAPIEAAKWSRSGDSLYFVENKGVNRTLMQMPVSVDENGVQLGEATPLFSMSENKYRGFDIGLNNEKFLVLKKDAPAQDEDPKEGIVLIQNWFEEFRESTENR